MQKGAARSAAVLQGRLTVGTLAAGSTGQNLFLEGREAFLLVLGDTCLSLSQYLVFQSLVRLTENLSWMLKAPVEDTGNIPLPLMGWQPWREVNTLLIDSIFLLLAATRRSLNAAHLPC